MKTGTITETIRVQTWGHRASRRSFSFNFKLWRNGVVVDEGNYSDGHTRSYAFIKKKLQTGWPTELVIERFF